MHRTTLHFGPDQAAHVLVPVIPPAAQRCLKGIAE